MKKTCRIGSKPAANAKVSRPAADDEPINKPKPNGSGRSPARRKAPTTINMPAKATVGLQRHQRPRKANPIVVANAEVGTTRVPAVAEQVEAAPGAAPVAAPKGAPTSDENMDALVSKIHEAALGAVRCGKATVEFARAAGQRLAEARGTLGSRGFDHWVERTLAITPAEARGLIDFAGDPEVATAAVSPTDATTLTQVIGLVGHLGHHVHQAET